MLHSSALPLRQLCGNTSRIVRIESFHWASFHAVNKEHLWCFPVETDFRGREGKDAPFWRQPLSAAAGQGAQT